ncbi:ribbon-helix-helix protein, CopG family [Microvirga aerilata]|uniref:Ribbon-helix-helix protein, CopG family n=1 Tax=Microvirga aerilata TaxID=670292 RepID=A0A937CZV4_9HYPH|nr:ribbon-helix-helix protein, CopG family [Microvirga aerilata]MBL0404447.1 ribbon-helix-helix protein, CopG family [Microvirga aerilata]
MINRNGGGQVSRVKVKIRDDLVLALDRVAERAGQSREALIEQVLVSFLAEQQRVQAIVDSWTGDDAGDL